MRKDDRTRKYSISDQKVAGLEVKLRVIRIRAVLFIKAH